MILKMDTTMIIWIIVWAIVAICLPFGLSSCLCCPNRRQRLNEDFSIRSESSTGDKTERVFGVLLHILLILFLAPLILILAGNEQISKSITKLPWTSGIIFKDLNTFLHNTHMQISFSLSSSIDITIDTIKKDLEDIPAFVGEPYQKDLSGETGIDVALLALEDLKSGTAKATTVIAELLEACAAAKVASVLFQNQVDEIARQLTIAKQLCETRDRPVCYTLQSSGYDVAFSVDNITTDYNIRQLDRIRMETNFNNSIDEARKKFEGIPNQVQMDSTQFVRDMKIVLSKKRTEVYKSIHALDVLARSTAETLRIKEERTKEVIRNIVNWDMWRWMVVLGMASFLGIIWGLLLCGAPCGCITTSKTISFLMTGITLSCISCIFIWVMGTIALVVGSHGKGFVCSSLYDYPRFEILGLMMDPHGFLYKKGAFEEFGTPNDPLQISEVLKYSQHDQTAYFTFHLFHQINITSVANYREWRDLEILFHNFSITEKAREEFLEPSLQLNLQTLAIASSANLTSLQKQAALPITNRDLNSFADQLHTVARQLSDAATARKFDNIAFSVKNLIRNELQKLSNIKNSILLKITMLEVLLPPLGKQANQSLAHLKSIQYFLDNEGWKLAEKSRKRFVARLENCLEELHNYVTKKVTKEIGKCRPLWEIFHSVRFYLCKLIVDPTNGIAFSSFFLILVFVATTPVVMKLVEYYKEYNDEELTLTSPRYPYTGFGPDEEETWTSPRSETSRLNLAVTSSRDQERLERSSSSSSPSPQRQSSSHIPVPPRLPTVTERVSAPRRTDEPSMSKSPRAGLSTISAKFSKARAYTHKSLSKGRSPRRRDRHHESLRLVEPTWRVGCRKEENYGQRSQADLEEALNAYRNNGVGLNECQRRYHVPKATLKRHLENKKKIANDVTKTLGRPADFDEQMETLLTEHILKLEERMFGLTITDIRTIAYDLAKKNHITNRFNSEKRMARKKMVLWFHAAPSSTLMPESTSIARAKGFNKERVHQIFDILEQLVDKYRITTNTIFNVDESGFSKRQVGGITSGETGVNTTVVCCLNAAGLYIPPMLIFKRKRYAPELGIGLHWVIKCLIDWVKTRTLLVNIVMTIIKNKEEVLNPKYSGINLDSASSTPRSWI